MKQMKPAAASLAALLIGSAVSAQDLEFYFPVAVGGGPADTIQALVDRYVAQTPGVTINAIYTGSYADTGTRAMTAARAGQPPAMAVLLATSLYQLYYEDIIEPINAHLSDAQMENWIGAFYPAFVGRVGDEVYSIPFQRSTLIMFWNKDAFAAAGLDPETPPATWAELVSMGQALTETDAEGVTRRWGLRVPSAGFPYWLFQGFVATNGSALMPNTSGTSVNFDDPVVIEALQFQYDLANVHGIMAPGAIDWGATIPAFFEGESAMIWNTTGNFSNIRDNAPFEWGAAMLPANTRRGAPVGGGNFYLFQGHDDATYAAAIDFLEWLTAPEQAAEWTIATGYIAPRPDAWETEALQTYVAEFPQVAIARDQLEFAIPDLTTFENARVTRAINDAISAVLTGQMSAEDALRDAQGEADRILAIYR